MEKNLKVKLLRYTNEPELTIATAGHLCYAGVDIGELQKKMDKEKVAKILNQLISSGHFSVLEHANFTFGIGGISRACTHQLVRHRIASYCLTGDTIIKGARQKSKNYKKFTLKSLYDRMLTSHGKSRLKLIRLNSYDEGKKEFCNGKIKDITCTGRHEVWEIKLTDGKSVKATLNHRFLTKNGWATLKEIIENRPELGVNGIACKSPKLALLRDKDWLDNRYNKENRTQEEIAEELDCSKHTVRAWVRRHGIQKETGGLHGHAPHRGHHWKLGRERTYEEKKISSERMKGPKNHRWRGGITPEATLLRKEISPDLRKAIYERDGYRCKLCNAVGGELTLHHKVPLHADKTKNADPKNLVTLCRSCHRKVNNHEHEYCDIFGTEPIPYHTKSSGCYRTIKWDAIESIKPCGTEETYDITMHEPNHNFVANGFVVHNSQQSQRYVDEQHFGFIVPPKVKLNKTQVESKENLAYEKFIKCIEESRSCYHQLIELGIPKEDARFVLPNAAETRIIVTMNARSLMNFFERRLCTRAQWEIRELANAMLEELKKAAPLLFGNAGPVCERLGYCPEAKGCGRYPPRNEIIKGVS